MATPEECTDTAKAKLNEFRDSPQGKDAIFNDKDPVVGRLRVLDHGMKSALSQAEAAPACEGMEINYDCKFTAGDHSLECKFEAAQPPKPFWGSKKSSHHSVRIIKRS